MEVAGLPSTSSSKRNLLTLVVLLVLGAGAVAFGMRDTSPPPSAEPPREASATEASAAEASATEASAAEASAAEASAAEASAAEASAAEANPVNDATKVGEVDEAPGEPPTIRVRVQAYPASASLRIDGEPVSNPYETERPADDATHLIEAEAEGFTSLSREVAFRTPVNETLSLVAEPEPARMRRQTMRATMTGQAMRRTTRMRPRMRTTMRTSRMAAGFTSDNPY